MSAMISSGSGVEVQDTEEVLAELMTFEPIFHRPGKGTSRTDFERMTAPDFWEVGASGRIYSRELVLDVLERRYAQPHTDHLAASGFRCRKLGEDTYLVTYNLIQDQTRHTRRSTIWERTPDGWRIVFHQGTIVQGS